MVVHDNGGHACGCQRSALGQSGRCSIATFWQQQKETNTSHVPVKTVLTETCDEWVSFCCCQNSMQHFPRCSATVWAIPLVGRHCKPYGTSSSHIM